ncbi:DUF1396 domain-containing protein [Streptomyces tagetis]|uniref:DUF1396 domain-containing protein n=1 Tax=Streptomyces tagetis TaxID=2820809 RepID=A0A940XKE4_9ACTN|nr:DUF1396 domain-containing protein [Streptomyces sp. RG38]MBQ0828737.1 DUF1396 domain-containing protein [Streptomyces sp. RG38]
MKTSVRVRVPVATGLAALLLAGGAVGCSQETKAEGTPGMTPAAAVAKAAKNSEDITSLHYRMTGRTPEEGRIEGEARMRLKPEPAMDMKVKVPDEDPDATVEVRLLDGVMYIGGGAEAAKELDGKSWVKFDLEALGAGGDLNELGGPSQADKNPAAESTFLTGAKDVREVGTETVEGVKTTHYEGTVTLADLEKSFQGDGKGEEERRKSLEEYKDLGVDKLTMDMWVDEKDRTKQFRMRGDASKGELDMTVTFLSYNEPVEITAPPAGETMDLAEMMEEMGQG